MRDTVLDMNNRISIQYTLDDVEKELAIFDKLLGNKKKDLELRKEMMKNYHIAKEDLDN